MVLSRRLPSSLVYTIGRSQYHATGALARTQRCCGRDTPPLDPRYKNMTSLTKPEVYITYRNAARRKPSHGYGRGNRHRRLGEVWSCVVPGICERAHRQTDRQTRSSQYSAPLMGRSDKLHSTAETLAATKPTTSAHSSIIAISCWNQCSGPRTKEPKHTLAAFAAYSALKRVIWSKHPDSRISVRGQNDRQTPYRCFTLCGMHAVVVTIKLMR